MPAKTVIFDHRMRPLHDFGASPHNFISFNPQGRLIALAGFGNLAGKIDMFDRRTLTKVCTIDAPNTSHCEWSPDGRFLLTATLSPRLRVDNGIKIWHCSGPLVHFQAIEELYQASWRPTPIDAVPPFGPTIPVAPEPSESVQDLAKVAKPAPTKPAGAYRPPGARGLATPSIFKREDEGGAARMPTNGTSKPPRGVYNRSPAPGSNGYGGGQQNGGGKRHVPGAAPKHSGSSTPDEREKKNKKKKDKKKENAKERAAQDVVTNGEVISAPKPEVTEIIVDQAETLGGDDGSVPPTPGELSLDPLAKKIRNLNKKVSFVGLSV
jgi:translation initiation factor 2A